ncbi:PDR/VanB family oxidoreductase [Rugosimonospora acidiphila]|uniref:PDR/VanB family oxidoreductase n=1 Tax=Rugosimonospora acidiphila TaxID=556531 RepID=A0ABP9S1L5_9ACTN
MVAGRDVVAAGVVRLTLRRPGGQPVPAWKPGAHIDLVLRDGLVRQYSLCGDPADRSALRVAVLREAAGRGGSAFVFDSLAAGRPVRVRGPRNHFPLVPAGSYLFIAGGIGITPILPMIAAVSAAGRPWRLVYGGRTRASMAFLDALADSANVSIVPQDEAGLIDLDAVLGRPVAGTAIYCCGPESLLAAVESRCRDWPPGVLHVERFAARPGAGDGPREAFEVEFARSRKVCEVPAGRSILQVADEAGVFVATSCEEGTCGTCETPVLSGEPDHRDSYLSPAERERGNIILVCVSRSRSPRLVLDL